MILGVVARNLEVIRTGLSMVKVNKGSRYQRHGNSYPLF